MREFKGKYAEFMLQDKITFVTILVKHLDLDIAKEIVADRLIFCRGENSNIFIDNRHIKTITKPARDYFGLEETNQKLNLIAIYASSTLSVFLGNFLIKTSLKNYTIPIRLFTDKNKAIEWIKSKY